MAKRYKNPFEDPEAEFYGKKVKDYKIPKRRKAPLEKKVVDADLKDYIYVPTIGLYVAKKRSLYNLSWEDTHKKLHKKGLQMLTIRQFIDFIQFLQTNPNKIMYDILDEILGEKKSWRGEWLDAKFIEGADELYISYNHRIVKGKLVAIDIESLEKCLMEDYYIIDLKSCNRQGLPTKRPTKRGNNISCYYPKYKGQVAGFSNGGDCGPILNCDWGTHPEAQIGVRAARKK